MDHNLWCTGNWGILAGGGVQLGELPVGDLHLSDFLGTIFIRIHFYLIDATNEHFSLSKIYLINIRL